MVKILGRVPIAGEARVGIPIMVGYAEGLKAMLPCVLKNKLGVLLGVL